MYTMHNGMKLSCQLMSDEPYNFEIITMFILLILIDWVLNKWQTVQTS